MESRLGPSTQGKAELLTAATGHTFEGVIVTLVFLERLWKHHSIPSVPSDSSGRKYGGVFFKRMCIELAWRLARVRTLKTKPSFTWRQLHLFEDLMATYHPPSIPDEVACKPSHISGPSDSFGGNMMSTSPAVCTCPLVFQIHTGILSSSVPSPATHVC